MFSIIICSISPERLSQLKANIQKTIGIEHEIIAFDNREKQYPIAKVYNEGARQARYPYLFFVHEDVLFHSENWGKVIAEKLKEPDCGAIGFAGSKIKPKIYSDWSYSSLYDCIAVYRQSEGGSILHASNVFLEHPFEEVITLDKIGIFVRKQLWEIYQFDEKHLTGFHGYDLDFSLQLAATHQFKNYVCTKILISVKQHPDDKFTRLWAEDIIRLHKQKWNAFLPLQIPGLYIPPKKEKKLTEKCFHYFVKSLMKSDYNHKWNILLSFFFYTLSWKHLSNSFANFAKYLRYLPHSFSRYCHLVKHSPFFDTNYYCNQCPEIREQGLNPIAHYLDYGWKEGKNPSAQFCNDAYLSAYSNTIPKSMSPLLHYLLKGRRKKFAICSVPTFEAGPISQEEIDKIRQEAQQRKTILFISHEQSQTGAPRALLQMAIVCQQLGAYPIVLAFRGGPISKEFEKHNIRVLVDPYIKARKFSPDSMAAHFIRTFDIIIFNTLETICLVEAFTKFNAKKIAWIHEGEMGYLSLGDWIDFASAFPLLDDIYVVGDYAKSFAANYLQDTSKLHILLYGIPDQSSEEKSPKAHSDGKIHFLLGGTLSMRKGQLILLQALRLLPMETRKHIQIWIAGSCGERRVRKAIKHSHLKSIKYVGGLDHERFVELFHRTDILLCPSLDDPMPIVCTEAMIASKTMIVSDRTGTAKLLKNGESGYIIPANDAKALADAIQKAIENSSLLPQMGQAARRVYDENFTMKIFQENVKKMLQRAIRISDDEGVPK